MMISNKSKTIKTSSKEKTLVECKGTKQYCGFLDITAMTKSDSIVLRAYVRIRKKGSYILFIESTYSKGQREGAIRFHVPMSPLGTRITIQQTKGSPKTFDFIMFNERESS